MSAALLDALAEDPEEPHVADEMHPATVHEHAGEKVGPAARCVAGELDGQKAGAIDRYLDAKVRLPGGKNVGCLPR